MCAINRTSLTLWVELALISHQILAISHRRWLPLSSQNVGSLLVDMLSSLLFDAIAHVHTARNWHTHSTAQQMRRSTWKSNIAPTIFLFICTHWYHVSRTCSHSSTLHLHHFTAVLWPLWHFIYIYTYYCLLYMGFQATFTSSPVIIRTKRSSQSDFFVLVRLPLPLLLLLLFILIWYPFSGLLSGLVCGLRAVDVPTDMYIVYPYGFRDRWIYTTSMFYVNFVAPSTKQ